MYEELAAAGLDYGPVFQGVRAAWRSGESVLAEVVLPGGEQAQAGSFGLHPALFDAALHALVVGGLFDDAAAVRLPFAWQGVSLYAAAATELRVRLTAVGPEAISLQGYDASGALVVSVDSLTLRSVSAQQLAAKADVDGLYGVEWARVVVPESADFAGTVGLCALGELVVCRVGMWRCGCRRCRRPVGLVSVWVVFLGLFSGGWVRSVLRVRGWCCCRVVQWMWVMAVR
ncbi:polyketide synthase dehydratase domain-containing protein [Streptomyces griseocarneus]|uniref:polyketide synthase dehydratase domain-containing protein n=1 Tax=Streptomyces griseocarneus TaxID=51201 RepID=UPI003D6CE84D